MLEILILTGVGVWLILALRSCFRGGRLLRKLRRQLRKLLPPLRSQPLTWPIPCFCPFWTKSAGHFPSKRPLTLTLWSAKIISNS